MATLMKASHQWATRPADERFTSLIALNDHVQHEHQFSRAKCVSSRAVKACPAILNETGTPYDTAGLQVLGPNGDAVNLTHWSFSQLAQRAGAPAGYLRDLPSPLAADCVNFGLQTRNVEDLGVLLYKNGGDPFLRAVTGPNYGRVWNSTITQALVNRFGDGITGDFRVPGEFGKQVAVTKANTTLYASDRDMFVFLADETHRIEIPNRRNGKKGSLARGFFIWNSEVGSTSLGIAMFLFDYVCGNRIVWGAEQIAELRVRHTVSAPARWIAQCIPAIERVSQSATEGVVKTITQAQLTKIASGTDELEREKAVSKFLAERFSNSQVSFIKAAHMAEEERPIESIWDAVTGITAYAKTVEYQDERVKLEREAGKLLQKVGK
ncbi:MAG TPA: DUF932 domain-containing protein [Steroidobacteraceae bacterium]|nr:DUF932 domain-containing protein [Steroidobacteraceae bacterium]